VIEIKKFRFILGKLTSIAHHSEREVQVLTFHAHPISLSFSELSFLLISSPLSFRQRHCIWQEIPIVCIRNLLILREVSWIRLRISIVELLLLLLLLLILIALIREVVIVVVHAIHHSKIVHVHVIPEHKHVVVVLVVNLLEFVSVGTFV